MKEKVFTGLMSVLVAFSHIEVLPVQVFNVDGETQEDDETSVIFDVDTEASAIPEETPASGDEEVEITENTENTEFTDHTETAEKTDTVEVTLSYEGDDYSVTASFDSNALPEGTELKVERIEDEEAVAEKKAEAEAYLSEQKVKEMEENDENTENVMILSSIGQFALFDISLLYEGNEVEPAEGSSVKVEITVNTASEEEEETVEETEEKTEESEEDEEVPAVPEETEVEEEEKEKAEEIEELKLESSMSLMNLKPVEMIDVEEETEENAALVTEETAEPEEEDEKVVSGDALVMHHMDSGIETNDDAVYEYADDTLKISFTTESFSTYSYSSGWATVKLDAGDGGTISNYSGDIGFDSSYWGHQGYNHYYMTLPDSSQATRKGYTLKGWLYKDENGNEVTLDPGASTWLWYTGLGSVNTTITAVWEKNPDAANDTRLHYIITVHHYDGKTQTVDYYLYQAGDTYTFDQNDFIYMDGSEKLSGIAMTAGTEVSKVDNAAGTITIKYDSQHHLAKADVYFKQVMDERVPGVVVPYDAEVNSETGKKEYDVSRTGLHTDKTATVRETKTTDGTDTTDGRTFDLTLETWNVGSNMADIGMVLDASGSMAWTSNKPTPIKYDDLSDKLKQTIKKSTSNSINYLTTDQVNSILDRNMTDNSVMGYSQYSYFVYDDQSTMKEYAPIGYAAAVNQNKYVMYKSTTRFDAVLDSNGKQIGWTYHANIDNFQSGWYYISSGGSDEYRNNSNSNNPYGDSKRYLRYTATTYTDNGSNGDSTTNRTSGTMTAGSPIKFYFDYDGYLHCFFDDGTNDKQGSIVYKKEDSENIKYEELQNAIAQFAATINPLSPESVVGMTRFSFKDFTSDELYLLDWTNDTKKITEVLNQDTRSDHSGGTKDYGLTGSTQTYTGIQAYIDKLAPGAKANGKYLIIFTDGKDSESTIGSTSKTLINQLKNQGYTIITIMMNTAVTSENTSAEAFLKEIASNKKVNGQETSDKLYWSVADRSELADKFLEIAKYIANSLTGYTVRDYIDPRFDLVDYSTGIETVLTTDENAKADLSLEYTSNNGKKGILKYDTEKDMFYIEWTNQEIPTNQQNTDEQVNVWSSVITVKAKKDFLGGNDILSNGETASLNMVFYPDSDGNPSNAGMSKVFPQTTVDPAILELEMDDYVDTIYLGESIDPDDYGKLLLDSADSQWFIEYLYRKAVADGKKDENGNVDKDYYVKLLLAGKDADGNLIPEGSDNALELEYYYLPNINDTNKQENTNHAGTSLHQSDPIGKLTYKWVPVVNNTSDGTLEYEKKFDEFTTTNTDDIQYKLVVTYEAYDVDTRKPYVKKMITDDSQDHFWNDEKTDWYKNIYYDKQTDNNYRVKDHVGIEPGEKLFIDHNGKYRDEKGNIVETEEDCVSIAKFEHNKRDNTNSVNNVTATIHIVSGKLKVEKLIPKGDLLEELRILSYQKEMAEKAKEKEAEAAASPEATATPEPTAAPTPTPAAESTPEPSASADPDTGQQEEGETALTLTFSFTLERKYSENTWTYPNLGTDYYRSVTVTDEETKEETTTSKGYKDKDSKVADDEPYIYDPVPLEITFTLTKDDIEKLEKETVDDIEYCKLEIGWIYKLPIGKYTLKENDPGEQYWELSEMKSKALDTEKLTFDETTLGDDNKLYGSDSYYPYKVEITGEKKTSAAVLYIGMDQLDNNYISYDDKGNTYMQNGLKEVDTYKGTAYYDTDLRIDPSTGTTDAEKTALQTQLDKALKKNEYLNEQLGIVQVINRPKANIKLVKSDMNHHEKLLEGAEFEVYTDEKCTKLWTDSAGNSRFTTDENGVIYIRGLEYDTTYYLKEVTSPIGYVIRAEVIPVNTGSYDARDHTKSNEVSIVSEDSVVKAVSEVRDETVDGVNVTYDITFYNGELYELPSSGGIGTYLYTLIGTMFLTMALLLYSKNRRKGVHT